MPFLRRISRRFARLQTWPPSPYQPKFTPYNVASRPFWLILPSTLATRRAGKPENWPPRPGVE